MTVVVIRPCNTCNTTCNKGNGQLDFKFSFLATRGTRCFLSHKSIFFSVLFLEKREINSKFITLENCQSISNSGVVIFK